MNAIHAKIEELVAKYALPGSEGLLRADLANLVLVTADWTVGAAIGQIETWRE